MLEKENPLSATLKAQIGILCLSTTFSCFFASWSLSLLGESNTKYHLFVILSLILIPLLNTFFQFLANFQGRVSNNPLFTFSIPPQFFLWYIAFCVASAGGGLNARPDGDAIEVCSVFFAGSYAIYLGVVFWSFVKKPKIEENSKKKKSSEKKSNPKNKK